MGDKLGIMYMLLKLVVNHTQIIKLSAHTYFVYTYFVPKIAKNSKKFGLTHINCIFH
jgi:hypothetical protein